MHQFGYNIHLLVFLQFSLQIVFAKGAHYALQEIATLGYEVVQMDWTVEPELGRWGLNGLIFNWKGLSGKDHWGEFEEELFKEFTIEYKAIIAE